MMQEAERALKNAGGGKKPQINYERYQVHIDACELAIIMIDNGFDEEDAIGRLYMDQHFTREGKPVNWSKTPFTPGKADKGELISPYTFVASAKYMYDMSWLYDLKDEMKPGSVVCDSLLRVVAKLHFSGAAYVFHQNKGNLKTTPRYVYEAKGALNTSIIKGGIFSNDTLTEIAQNYLKQGTAIVRIDVPKKTNHIGIPGYRMTSRTGEIVMPVYHAANKKDNMKIDYVNLSTGEQYFSPKYNKRTKTVMRNKTTWNKFTQLTYVEH